MKEDYYGSQSEYVSDRNTAPSENNLTQETVSTSENNLTQETVSTSENNLTQETVSTSENNLTQETVSTSENYISEETPYSDEAYVTEENPYADERYANDNPVPDEYEAIEYIAALSIVGMAILVGTGRSIKYLESDRKTNKTGKPVSRRYYHSSR